jgi:hypothetical protein
MEAVIVPQKYCRQFEYHVVTTECLLLHRLLFLVYALEVSYDMHDSSTDVCLEYSILISANRFFLELLELLSQQHPV